MREDMASQDPHPSAPAPDKPPPEPEGPIQTLERMEALLRELRATVDEIARERWRRELSPTRVIGAILQVIVVGLLVLAVFDWAFQSSGAGLTKLAFAATLQLVALTAFVVSRDGR